MMTTTTLGTVLHRLGRSLLCQDEAEVADGELLECFISRRDEGAFEALVRRHGPMVLGVCRRVLHNEADAEDAFQATFLVLVRKAVSIRPRGMVGNWLYGVAHTTALKARAMNTKQLAKAREAAARLKPAAATETWEASHALLDQELKVLPDKYRAAIVLCDLEGKSIKDAARQLGCPAGTIGTRLARGRSLLARRLARQGIALSGGIIAAAMAQGTATAGVPPLLVSSTIKAAAMVAAGQAVQAGVVSAKVAALTQGVLKAMLMTKLKNATAVALMILTVSVGAWGVGATAATGTPIDAASLQATDPQPAPKERGAQAQPAQDAGKAAKEAKNPSEDAEQITAIWITEKRVQDELRLTEAQVKKLMAIRSDVYRKYEKELKAAQEEAKKHNFARYQELSRKLQDEERKALTEAAPQILSAGALKRLRQIQRQARGLHNLIREPAVQKKLDLNDEQLKQIEGFLQEGAEEVRKARKADDSPVYGPLRIETFVALEQKAYAGAMKKAVGVLTPEQRRIWIDLVGEPFAFKADAK